MNLRRFLAASALGAALALAAPGAAQNDNGESPPLPASSTARSEAGPLRVEVVARGLVHPWAVAALPDGRMLVTERNDGRLRIVGRDGRISAPVAGVPEIFRYRGETDRSQAGLFDVKLHPGFAANRLVYLSFSEPTERGASVTIVRGRLAEAQGSARLEELRTIFRMREEDQDSSGLHFGGRMAIDAQRGHLYLTIGDRRNISRSQEGEDQAGSILRLTLDGEAPRDNPFVGDEEVDDHIFAKGSRNSQALALQPDGTLWSIEHGPKGGDRVDRIRAGINLGWPFVTGGVDYSGAPIGAGLAHEGMTSPLHVFEETVAPSGALFYDGAMFAPWRGNLLVGGLYNESIMRLTVGAAGVSAVERIEIGRRIRDLALGADGAIWAVTEHEDGELIRISRGR